LDINFVFGRSFESIFWLKSLQMEFEFFFSRLDMRETELDSSEEIKGDLEKIY